MDMLDANHQCPWKTEALALRAELAEIRVLIGQVRNQTESASSASVPAEPVAPVSPSTDQRVAELEHQLEILKRQLFGKKSEKRPAPYKPPMPKADPAVTQQKRRDNAALRDDLPVDEIAVPIKPEACVCKKCGGVPDKVLPPNISEELELVQAHFRVKRYLREVKACRCGDCFVEAPVLARVQEKSPYGPGVYAATIAARCCDSLPFYRLSKSFKRAGVLISDRTLGDMFHRAAEIMEPLYKRLMQRIAAQEIVQADETPVPMMAPEKTKRAFMWTFLAGALIGFRFAESRSGQTPVQVLGGTRGTLVVDAYSGYNEICLPEQRERCGCLAHLRRKFVDARSKDEAACAKALDLILAVYRVEHQAKELGIVRTPAHRELRQTKGKAAMAALKAWLDAEQSRHLPKGPMGKAIQYALNQWSTLQPALDDPRIPIDNNNSESALRVIALGRKNWLFVGNDVAGQHLAILMSLVRSCEASGVNPQEYLKDVLLRVASHPISRIDELLPDQWRQLMATG